MTWNALAALAFFAALAWIVIGLAIAVIDLRTHRIPNRWLAYLLVPTVALMVLAHHIDPFGALAGGVFCVALGIGWLHGLYGGGDFKLMGVIALVQLLVPLAFLVTTAIDSMVGLCLGTAIAMGWQRWRGYFPRRVAFAPALIGMGIPATWSVVNGLMQFHH